ncbi:MAG: peptide chain release factor N(5)-glutamine methyltransferase [Anaerolineales bacterium]|nr:peptide chain release factor N(5)-glutamine methyltransferase [Anaerolineales bacterium]
MTNELEKERSRKKEEELLPPTSFFLNSATAKLAHTDSPRLTAEVLLARVLNVSRAHLLAYPERLLSETEQQQFTADVHRAAEGVPLAYIVGHKEFHGLEFLVNKHVLVPRPETELLVDLALEYLSTKEHEGTRSELRVLDVGTGSGCIAVTVAVKCPRASVTALDISEEALAVAQANAARHGVVERLSFFKSDLLSALNYLPAQFHLLTAKLPYIATDVARALPVSRHEPLLALDGGPDGLLWVRRLLTDAPRHWHAGGLILLEIGHTQGPAAHALAQAVFPAAHVQLFQDWAGLDRIIRIQTTA